MNLKKPSQITKFTDYLVISVMANGHSKVLAVLEKLSQLGQDDSVGQNLAEKYKVSPALFLTEAFLK